MKTELKDVVQIDTENEQSHLDIVKTNNIRFTQTSKEIDLKALGLKSEDMNEIIELKNNFGEISGLSVAEYGKNISNNNQTSELLKLVKNKDLDETGDKLNQIITVAKDINSSNFVGETSTFSKLPIVGSLFKSVDKAKQKFELKFANTDQQITNLMGEIEINQNGLKDRINLLDGMYDNVQNDYRSLGIHIAAGKLKLKEVQEEIVSLSNIADSDQNANLRIS